MKLRSLLLTLLLSATLLTGLAVPAGADAVAEDFWNYAYQVDKIIVVDAKDDLGLYMRHGAGTEYPKVCPETVPMGTRLYITQETTDSRGWKWGLTEYDFPDGRYSGWVCLVETYEVTEEGQESTAPAPQPEPAPVEEPAVPETPADPAPTEPGPPAEDTAAAETEAPAQETGGPIVYSSLMLVGIGIVIGVVVLTALLLLLRKKK